MGLKLRHGTLTVEILPYAGGWAIGGKSFGRFQTLPASKGDAKTSCLPRLAHSCIESLTQRMPLPFADKSLHELLTLQSHAVGALSWPLDRAGPTRWQCSIAAKPGSGGRGAQ